ARARSGSSRSRRRSITRSRLPVRSCGSRLRFGSHAASAAAAAVAFGSLGAYAVPPLAAAMCLSRLVVGVHYPSDVAAGAALGVLTARLGARRPKGGRRG
ncbi:phosphatase PAP2 family protein, partial [Streptomyces humidus]|uniref:phosphatase PAP2 family protein n=1 Tax=Streptomyces humidus TaxID=52259 RepID=UPI003D9EF87B